MAFPSRWRLGQPLGLRSGAHHPAPAPGHGLPAEHDDAEHHQHQGQGPGGGQVERHLGLGEDLGGEGLVAEDLEGAVLGQDDQGHQEAAPEDGPAGLADRDPQEGADAAEPEAAGHLLLAGIGAPQAGRHRQVDQRVDGEGHDQYRAPEP